MLSSLSGVYSAAHDLNVEWIIIKGVSDFADGKKSETNAWRPFASLMAASFVAHILSNPIHFEDLPHYNNGKTSLRPSSGDYQTDVFNFSNDNYKTNNQQCSKIQKKRQIKKKKTNQDATDSTPEYGFFKIKRPQ